MFNWMNWRVALAMLNRNVRYVISTYGWTVASQLLRAGWDYAAEKHLHPTWTQAERRAFLSWRLKQLDLVPTTTVDEQAIGWLVDYFLPEPRK